MKRLLFLLLTGSAAGQTIPAFPGAEGYGAYAKGGRGGDVYVVTNLNASGAGSFAHAISTVPSAGRTIVFAVSGYIRLPSGSNGTRLTASKVTIAGQTAPGDGIGFTNNFLRLSGDDLVMRHLRFRRGKTEGGGDCINLDSGCNNAVLDHLSVMWSTDENISSFSSAPDNLTFQYSFNAWGLESHSCGGLWDQKRCTTHHTLWAHNHTRNPKARPGMLEWINNVTFDWDIGFILGDSQSNQNWNSNLINNYFICPPGNLRPRALTSPYVASNGRPNFTIHLAGNLTDNDGDGTLNGVDKGYTIAEGTAHAPGTSGLTAGTKGYYQAPAPLAGSAAGVATDDALTAYKKIVSNAGALRLDAAHPGGLRDEVDTRLVNNLVTRTANHISRPSQLGIPNDGFGTLAGTSAPLDTDQDGMPDHYEDALGWNKAAQDHNTALASSGGFVSGTTYLPTNSPAGYTRLEEYLHFKAIPHAWVAKNTAPVPSSLNVDLRKFTTGFANAPVFTLSNVTGGTATQSGAGGGLVHFVPALNSAGRAKFDFTVTDADGSAWTQQFAILVTVAALPRDLTWAGDGVTNAWNATAGNWVKDGAVTTFDAGDYAAFGDAGSASPPVSLTESVAPSLITVTGSKNYTFTGGGSITSTGGLVKSGPGALTLANSGSNAIAGNVLLQEGTLALNSGGLGPAKITMQGGTLTSNYGATTALTLGGGIAVPSGVEGTVNMSPRMAITGGSGGGTLHLNVPGTTFIYDALNGSFSGFTGTLNVTGTVANALLTAHFNGGSFNGALGSATVNLDNVKIIGRHNSGGNTLTIGALTGTSTAQIVGSGYAGAMTLSTGALNRSTTFAGAITDGVAPTIVTKTGTGTLALSGTNTYTGATTLSGGGLLVSGSLGTTPVAVASGTTLSGAGTLGGAVTVASGGTVSPGNSPGEAGELTVGALSLQAAKLPFDLSSSPGGDNDHIQIASGGALTILAGALNFQFHLTDGILGEGTYDLVNTTGTLSASGSPTMSSNLPASGTRQTFALQRTGSGGSPGYIRLAVSGTAANLLWTGSGSSWDKTSTTSWSTSAPDKKFYNFDAVAFDNTATSGIVSLSGALQPRAITVDNGTVHPYTFDGSAGRIGGAGSLTKSGTGTLTISVGPSVAVASTNAANSTTVTVADAAGLAAGMLVEGNGVPAETVITSISGTTLTLSNAVASANSAAGFTYSWKNTFSGGTVIHAGSTIVLANDNANMWGLGTGPITFNGGTLSMYNNQSGFSSGTMHLIVPAGQTGTLNADSRHDLHGTLTGGGTLNFHVPWIRTELFSDWSAFTGTINVTTDADGGDFRMATSYSFPGFPLASVNLADRVSAYYTGILAQGEGTVIRIGELSGGPLSTLRGGATGGRNFTYRIGEKTAPAAEVVFAGTIAEQNESTTTALVKTGAGTWTLSGAGTWNGGTQIEQGTLKLSGDFASGAAVQASSGAALELDGGTLATESTNIDHGATLRGHGTLDADFSSGGVTEGRGVATGTPGTLAILGNATFGGSSLVRLRGGASSDLVAVQGDLALDGTIEIHLSSGTGFGRYPLFTYGGSPSGEATLIGIPAGITAHLSTTTPGQVALVIDDSDEDHLPDSWEQANFSGLGQTAADDFDDDGTPNLAEYRLGLDPKNGSSAFKATLSGYTLTWPSADGIVFTVKRSLTLEGAWQAVGTVTGGPGSSASFTDAASFEKAFYRVEFTP